MMAPNMLNGLKLVNGPFATLLMMRISLKQLNAHLAVQWSDFPMDNSSRHAHPSALLRTPPRRLNLL
jgi:hypothetical protein